MKRLIIATIILLLPSFAYPCDTLQECLAALPTTAKSGKGISKVERDLTQQILPYGAEAVPGLMEYLRNDDEEVRDLAGYILIHLDIRDEAYLPELIDAHKAGTGWVLRVIADIGNDEAMRYIMSVFEKERRTSASAGSAILTAGSKAIPYLTQYFNCNKDCDRSFLFNIGELLGDMGDSAREAAPALKEIAFATNSDAVAREAARDALIEIRAPETVDLLIQRIKELPHTSDDDTTIQVAYILGDLSSMGHDSLRAGELIRSRLSSRDRTIKILAEKALGYVGYEKAIPDLLALLRLDNDYLEVYVAAESLGRLRAKSALSALEEIQKDYWYPPVREAAGKAIRVIRGEDGYEKGQCQNFYPWEFLSHARAGEELKPCKSTNYELFEYSPKIKFYAEKNKSLAKQLNYITTLVTYGER